MLVLYNIVLLLGGLVLIPFYLVKMWRTGKYRRSFWQRLGNYRRDQFLKNKPEPLVWIHGCSVGETMASFPLLEKLKHDFPDRQFLSSVVTETGFTVAEKEQLADQVIYFPLDFPFSVRRAFDGFSPGILIIMETEIWPNVFWQASRRNIPIIIANGRISDKSFPTYQSYRWFFKHVLTEVDLFCMQSDEEASRIIGIGAPSSRVLVTGNTKFDQIDRVVRRTCPDNLRQMLQIPEGKSVLVGGSTHYNEEKQVVTAYKELCSRFPDMVLILAPRHPERIPDVFDYLVNECLDPVLLSDLRNESSPPPLDSSSVPGVVLVDTVGDLAALYSLATVVFVGGSLVPAGGHNILEPAAFGKPVIFGPHTFNFVEETLLLKGNGGFQIEDHRELTDCLLDLLSDREKILQAGTRARSAIETRTGSSQSIIDAIKERKLI
ncbi:MAG: 3-deoxy-D-manno-octulosonic acid transferase [bacterium]|jgi:3-deoxy-D-manno-octulosonic-acid transferase|nr:3-deoxy-D-manno-octulosonic acid transferase [bacterium]